jgi:3',5'-nucleoside bisphosphate phosphatase
VAAEHGFLASAGSDYHGPEKTWMDLGRLPPLPPQCIPVWRDWKTTMPDGRKITAGNPV